MEKFNPFNSEYKKVADLPKEEQRNFVDFENGFVRKEAMDLYSHWKNEAALANEGRSLFRKIFLPGEKSYQEFMVTDAKIENEKYQQEIERESREKMFDLLKNELVTFAVNLAPIINKHGIDLIISEDRSGRFPAEILHAAINKIYKKKGETEINLIGADIGRNSSGSSYDTSKNNEEAQLLIKQISAFAKNGTAKRGLLYVTEYVSSGNSLTTALLYIDYIIKKMESAGIMNTEFFGVYSMGGKISRVTEKLGREFNSNVRDGKYQLYQGESNDTSHKALQDYSGLYFDLNEYEQSNKSRMIRLISDLMVQEIEKEK